MKKLLLAVMLLLASASAHAASATYTLSVAFSSAAVLPSDQRDLLAMATTYFKVTLTKTPYGSDTYSLTVHGKSPVTIPPPFVEHSIVNATAFDECISYGFADGMDFERGDDLKLIDYERAVDISSGTCARVAVSTETFQNCQNVYDRLWQGIKLRDFGVWTSTGGVIVAPPTVP